MAQINLGGSISTTGTPILGKVDIVLTNANHTLTVAEYTNHYINVTGTLTAERDLIAPLTPGTSYIVNNATTGGFSVRFIGATGTGVSISNDSRMLVVTDGYNFYPVSAAASNNAEIEFSGYGIIQDGLAEVNQFITNPRFKADYNFTPASVVLTDDDGNDPKNVSGTPNSFYSDGYFQKLTFGEEVNFTLTTDGYYTNTFKVVWGQRNYYGVGPAGSNSAEFITSLNSVINNSSELVFSVNAGPTEKIYYAFRTAYGTPSIFFNGIEGGFAVVSTTISVTNPYGFTENYTLYESDNLALGITSVEVF